MHFSCCMTRAKTVRTFAFDTREALHTKQLRHNHTAMTTRCEQCRQGSCNTTKHQESKHKASANKHKKRIREFWIQEFFPKRLLSAKHENFCLEKLTEIEIKAKTKCSSAEPQERLHWALEILNSRKPNQAVDISIHCWKNRSVGSLAK